MRFSMIVPVLNEEAVLEDQLIHRTRQCTHHACEVPIVDGGSHDGTGEIARRYGKVMAAPRGRATHRLVALTTNLRSQVRTVFMRAASFKAVGGYPDQHLMEDLEIMRRLWTRGKVVLLLPYVTTSARRHEKMGLPKSVLFL